MRPKLSAYTGIEMKNSDQKEFYALPYLTLTNEKLNSLRMECGEDNLTGLWGAWFLLVV